MVQHGLHPEKSSFAFPNIHGVTMSKLLTGHFPGAVLIPAWHGLAKGVIWDRAKLSMRARQWCNAPVVHQHSGLTLRRGLQEDMVPLPTHPTARESLKWGPSQSY